jgi:hypothetical protein
LDTILLRDGLDAAAARFRDGAVKQTASSGY